MAAQADRDAAQGTVIHVHAALPDDPRGVDAQLVSKVQVVVDRRRQQVIGRGDRMEVPGEVEIQILHRDDLGVAAAGGTALDTKAGAQGGLAQCEDCLLSKERQRIGKADGDRGLALSCSRRVDGSDQDQLSVLFVLQGVQIALPDLCLVLSVVLQSLLRDAGLCRDLPDGFLFCFLGDFNI